MGMSLMSMLMQLKGVKFTGIQLKEATGSLALAFMV